jgi:hypothetical protein
MKGGIFQISSAERFVRKLIFPFAIVLSGSSLIFVSQYSYLLFHSLVEITTCVIAFGVFVIAWSSRRYIENNFLLILGVGYFFVGSFDLIHALSYEGMQVFPANSTDMATQFWIIARYTEAFTFLIALLFLKKDQGRSVSPPAGHFELVFFIYGFFFVLSVLTVFYWGIFPSAYSEGAGLTDFKKTSEYIISGLFMTSVFLLFFRRRMLDKKMASLLSLSLLVKVAAEISFVRYVGIDDFSNMLGHIFKFISFILLYKAVLEIGLMNPYHFLFRNLKKSQEEYRIAQSKLQERIEENLLEAYEQLGMANRKISLLLEMEAHSYQKKNKDEIVEYIVDLAKKVSHAKMALLYCANGKKTFSLVCEKDIQKDFSNLKEISMNQVEFLKELVSDKKRICSRYNSSDFGHPSKKLDLGYFIALPLVRQNTCRGFLFLGYKKQRSMETQELEFLDVFSIHAASALARLGVIEK